MLHAFAASVVVRELEGVESANPFENSMTDMALGVVLGHPIRITHRLPKSAQELASQLKQNYR
jgi:hypothetical protein